MKYLIIMSLILFGCGKSEDKGSVKDNTVVVKPVPKPDPKPDPDPIPDPIPDPKPDPKPAPKAEHFYKLCVDENYIGEGRHTINVIMQEYNLPTCLDAAIWINRTDELRLYGKDIVSMEPMKELINLTFIDARNNQITDISDLKNLTNLTSLALNDNKIKKINELSKLEKLVTLVIENNPINDLSSLCVLKNLEWLDFRNYKSSRERIIKGLQCIERHKNLELLYMSNLKIEDTSFLSSFKKLEYLAIDSSNIRNMDFLSTGFEKLIVLSLEKNNLVNISNIENMKNLEVVIFWFNEITDISPLHSLKKLNSIILDDELIKKNDMNCPTNKELPKPIEEFCFGSNL